MREFGDKLMSVIPRNKNRKYLYADLQKDLLIYKNPLCISGHSMNPFVDFREYEPQMKWFFFIRNPINSFISLYIQQYTSKDPKFKIGFSEWMKKYNRKNRMVSWIAGEENLDKAIEIIEAKIKFIGITEKFDESLILLKSNFNLKSVFYIPKMKSRDPNLKHSLTENVAKYEDQILSNNKLDIELYNYIANNIYPIQIKNYGEKNLLYDVSHFQKLNSERKNRIQSLKLNVLKYKLKRNIIYKPIVSLNKFTGN
jgi:hypothetical protein